MAASEAAVITAIQKKGAVMVEESKGLGGLVPIIIGVAFMLVAVFDPRDEAFPSGRMAVVAAGAVFVLAGNAVLINALKTRYRRLLLTLNGTFLLLSFASVPLLLSLGKTGERLLLVPFFICIILVVVGVGALLRESRPLRDR